MQDPISKTRAKGVGSVAQTLAGLPTKHEALSSNPSPSILFLKDCIVKNMVFLLQISLCGPFSLQHTE
jgi:hypothetical protein